MDYEKKYNEALAWMRELYPVLHGATKEDAEHYFPELRESEDEQALRIIKKRMCYDPVPISDEDRRIVENWLEKQKYDRMKPIYDARESFESALEKAWNDYHNGYENVDKLEDDYVECAHAKGFREGYLFGIEKQKEQNELPLMGGYADLYFDEWNLHKQNPTKRQCFKEGMRYARRLQKEQKPAWSEEDEKHLDYIIKYITHYDFNQDEMGTLEEYHNLHNGAVNFLKSLRPSWKPSEEQMEALEVAFRKDGDDEYRNIINSLYNDLKRL